MMRLILPVLLALLGLGGGVGAAILLRLAPVSRAEVAPVGAVPADLPPCGDTGTVPHPEGHAADSPAIAPLAGGDALVDVRQDDSTYTELGDQFVVPVVEKGSVTALVVLSLSVETAPGFGGEILAHAPKLRDAFLRELLDHANLGGFKGAFTSNGTMDRLRTALRETGQKTMGRDLRDVLILEINRQELG